MIVMKQNAVAIGNWWQANHRFGRFANELLSTGRNSYSLIKSSGGSSNGSISGNSFRSLRALAIPVGSI